MFVLYDTFKSLESIISVKTNVVNQKTGGFHMGIQKTENSKGVPSRS